MKTLTLLAFLCLLHSAAARTWTSADAARTFEAELTGFKDGKVTVRRSDGKILKFAIDLLSEADQKFVRSADAPPATPAAAGSWPRWRGSDFSDRSPDTGLLKEWPDGGPKQLWIYKDAGKGYSGPAIVGGVLFTMGARDAMVVLIALDAASGKELWSTELSTLFRNNWGDGPRGTPTVDGDRVYALGAKGTLICVEAKGGKKLWDVNLKKDFGGAVPGWGYTESVLVDGDKVLCTPGGKDGAVLALDKMSGKKLWQSSELTDGAQYASLIPIEHRGRRQYVQLFTKTLAGISAEDGDLLWRSEWGGSTAVIPTPIYRDGFVYVASGYGAGCKLVELEAKGATDVYQNKVMVNHHGGVVLVGDHLYGHSDDGGWKCQDFRSGKELWRHKGVGKGAVHYADGMLYCLGEKDGSVALVKAGPERWDEKGRFKLSPQSEIRAGAGKIWTHPVVIGGKLYLRDQDLIYCYDVKG
jgi:outer membrane protein assembly factor BamB